MKIVNPNRNSIVGTNNGGIMLITLIVLSTAGIKNETPPATKPKLQCMNPVKGSTKLEPSDDYGTTKCIATPEQSPKKSIRVPK
jgi:hypothetical protein